MRCLPARNANRDELAAAYSRKSRDTQGKRIRKGQPSRLPGFVLGARSTACGEIGSARVPPAKRSRCTRKSQFGCPVPSTTLRTSLACFWLGRGSHACTCHLDLSSLRPGIVRTLCGSGERVWERLSSLRDSDLFPTPPSTPPAAPCWARLCRPAKRGWN